ncbi:MAG: hypothetical protein AB7F86_03090 [Bdellovibrionales bacterium]
MKKFFVVLAVLFTSLSAFAHEDVMRCQTAAEEALYADWKAKNPGKFGEVLSHITDVAVHHGNLVSYFITIDATMGGTSRKWLDFTVRTLLEDGECQILKIKKFSY